MVRYTPILLAACLAAGCSADRRSSFRLPPGGDAARGQAAFLAFGCPECHSVSGLDLPRPAVVSPAPVVLGGTVNHQPTDAYLVTSVIAPSEHLARYPARDIPVGGKSRMPHSAERMTVQQLTDIVAFLQSRYILRPVMPD